MNQTSKAAEAKRPPICCAGWQAPLRGRRTPLPSASLTDKEREPAAVLLAAGVVTEKTAGAGGRGSYCSENRPGNIAIRHNKICRNRVVTNLPGNLTEKLNHGKIHALFYENIGAVRMSGHLEHHPAGDNQAIITCKGEVTSRCLASVTQQDIADSKAKIVGIFGRQIEKVISAAMEKRGCSPDASAEIIGDPEISVEGEHAIVARADDPMFRAHLESQYRFDARFDVSHSANADPISIMYAIRKQIAENVARDTFASFEAVMGGVIRQLQMLGAKVTYLH